MSELFTSLTGELDMQSPAIGGNRIYVDISKLSAAEMALVKGERGEIGLQGEQGIQGETGPQGIPGPQGEPGPQGLEGPQGIQGERGETGAQGVQGLQGEKGDKGDTGLGWDQDQFDNLLTKQAELDAGFYDKHEGTIKGLGSVSVPLDAEPGFAQVGIRGLSLTNLAPLRFMAAGFSYVDMEWGSQTGTTFGFIATAPGGGFRNLTGDVFIAGHEFFAVCRVKASSSNVVFRFLHSSGEYFDKAHSGSGDWEIIGNRFIATFDGVAAFHIADIGESDWQEAIYDDRYSFRIIDLTASCLQDSSDEELIELLAENFSGLIEPNKSGCIEAVGSREKFFFVAPHLRSNADGYDEVVFQDGRYYNIQRIDESGNTLPQPLELQIITSGAVSAVPGDTFQYFPVLSIFKSTNAYGVVEWETYAEVLNVYRYDSDGEHLIPPSEYSSGNTSLTLNNQAAHLPLHIEMKPISFLKIPIEIKYAASFRESFEGGHKTLSSVSDKSRSLERQLGLVRGAVWAGESLGSLPADIMGYTPRDLRKMFGNKSIKDTFNEITSRVMAGNYRELRLGDYIDLPSLVIGADSVDPTTYPAKEITNNPSYENLRLEIVGINDYHKIGAATQSNENHITFMFKNIPFKAKMSATQSTEGGYAASGLSHWMKEKVERAILESTGLFYFVNIRRILGLKAGLGTLNYETVFLPTSMSVFGYPGMAYPGGTECQYPLFALNPSRRVKTYNGVCDDWWLAEPIKDSDHSYCISTYLGSSGKALVDNSIGIVPVFII